MLSDKLFRAAGFLLPMLLPLSATAAEYKINANHTQVFFTYTHLGFSHISGRLTQPSGHFEFDPAAPANSSIEVELPIDSLSTGIPALDKDLRGPNFFDIDRFPTASFKSGKVSVVGEGQLDVAGDLTIHGITRPIVLHVTVNKIAAHPFAHVPAAGFDATATLNRSDFGLGRMVPMTSDEVGLRITMEAQQASAD